MKFADILLGCIGSRLVFFIYCYDSKHYSAPVSWVCSDGCESDDGDDVLVLSGVKVPTSVTKAGQPFA